ncbi:hypothetical protein F4677DRAFT_277260 [Hypoxylon crocopeplum]|nr:hypothetical protein F4677DRAFT_277260 [Hypoxylon crocopeplum]
MDNSVAVEASWRKSPSPGNEAQEKYQCPRCPSSFKRPEHLKRHQRSHDGHKPFMCSICLKRFFRSDILTRHELMHVAAQRTNHTLTRKRACTECARARERCSRDEPCLRCSTKSLQCLYPDDAGQKSHSLSGETSTSPGNEYGQLEEYSQHVPRNSSILPRHGGYTTSDQIHRESYEETAPLRDFIHTLRSPTTSSYAPDPEHSSSLLYQNSSSRRGRRSRSSIAHGSAGGESSSFVEQSLETGRQAPLFDQPAGSSFNRPHIHDAISLDDAHFGQYSDICATDPPFDYHSEAMKAAPQSQPGGSRGNLDPFLSMHADQQRGAGVLGSVGSDSETAASQQGLLSLSDFGSRPINLKAYEVIASNFKELCLDQGDGASSASSNNISESQRTAQHELFVKLYYEHFKQQAY